MRLSTHRAAESPPLGRRYPSRGPRRSRAGWNQLFYGPTSASRLSSPRLPALSHGSTAGGERGWARHLLPPWGAASAIAAAAHGPLLPQEAPTTALPRGGGYAAAPPRASNCPARHVPTRTGTGGSGGRGADNEAEPPRRRVPPASRRRGEPPPPPGLLERAAKAALGSLPPSLLLLQTLLVPPGSWRPAPRPTWAVSQRPLRSAPAAAASPRASSAARRARSLRGGPSTRRRRRRALRTTTPPPLAPVQARRAAYFLRGFPPPAPARPPHPLRASGAKRRRRRTPSLLGRRPGCQVGTRRRRRRRLPPRSRSRSPCRSPLPSCSWRRGTPSAPSLPPRTNRRRAPDWRAARIGRPASQSACWPRCSRPAGSPNRWCPLAPRRGSHSEGGFLAGAAAAACWAPRCGPAASTAAPSWWVGGGVTSESKRKGG